MDYDVARHIGAVAREVRACERDGKPARAVIAGRRYDTGIEDAWDALTNGERIPRWFLPIGGDLRLGGRYQIEGNAGGTIIECEPPRRLALSWEFAGTISWVTVTLDEEAQASTRLVLEHVALIDPQFEGFWGQFGPGATGIGWDLSLLGLASYLEDGAGKPPEGDLVWLASENGKAFVGASSEAWRAAAIAFGTDPGQAKEAADRTVQAYTAGG
ncbi:MAG: hypothetical protein QOD42_1956 [Sphingomonadales bacterium]|jgi:uncharacterized protein YndB with AHSA1/START domain|nr:hypothetical protein [Sphingomonadales bacterium]